ncbi:MAG: cyclase family protein [Flavobacteriales bacterium]|jgi:kynurenine formamidase
MEVHVEIAGQKYSADLHRALDLSISIRKGGVKAWYVEDPDMEPVRYDSFIGSVSEGGKVNFRAIRFNPHGHGTHTECLGHITPEVHSVNRLLGTWFFTARLVTITPILQDSDRIITRDQVLSLIDGTAPEALIIRTLPNDRAKQSAVYSATNFPYIAVEAMEELVSWGIRHLLIDLPSVDREEDGGLLAAHRAFWREHSGRMDCTITELIYVPDEILDGWYLLNLQVAPIENDASPSRPVIFPLHRLQDAVGKEK